jgi:hypothetical protein
MLDMLFWIVLGAMALLLGASLLATSVLLLGLLGSLLIVTPIKGLTRMGAALCGKAPPAWTQQNGWSEDLAESLPCDKALLLAAGVGLGYVLATPDKD